MKNARRLLGGAIATAVFLTAFGSIASPGAASTAPPKHVAQTTPPPAPTPTPMPRVSPTTLPYPAYGTPAPGAARTTPSPTIPQQVSLAQAIAVAAARSPVLAQARAQYALSKGQYDLSKTPILPNVFANASISRISGSGTRAGGNFGGTGTGAGTTGAVGGGGGITSENYTLQLQQLIYNGGRTIAQIHSAASSYDAAGSTYERNLQTLAFNVGQAYFTALAAHYATLVAAQVVQQNIVQENLIRAQIKAGTEARSNLLAAEVPTAQARVTLVKAQGTEISAYAAFANALGLDANTAVAPLDDAATRSPQTLLKSPILDYDTAVKRALALRPDYLAAERQAESAQYALKAAKLGRAPSLTGNASTGTASASAGGGNLTASSNIGATLTIPIFDQGITNAQVEQAQAQLDNANAFVTDTALTVQLNVRQALAGLISAEAAVSQTETELANALEQVKATQAQYKAGVTTLPLLLQAQTNLTTAQTDRLTSIYQLRQAEQTYLFDLGESDMTYTTH